MKKIMLFAAVAASMLFTACGSGNKTAKLETQEDSLTYLVGAYNMYQQMGGPENLNTVLLQMGSDSAFVKDFLSGVQDGFNSAENKKDIAYYMGASYGAQMRMSNAQQLNYILFGNDSTQTADMTNVLLGFLNAANGTLALKGDSSAVMNLQVIQAMLNKTAMSVNDKRIKKQYAPQIEKETKYFEELKKQEGVKTLENGVYYKELAAGDGKSLAGKNVKVEYEGRLLDGTVFDKGEMPAVPVGRGAVIPGFDIALAAMSVGAEWEISIPAKLAYGEQPMDKIPAMSALVFKVKVVGIAEQPKAPAQPQMIPVQ